MARQKFCFVIASVVAVSILFNSVVYACSKFAPAALAPQLASMDNMAGMAGGMIERGPCADHKQDICKSVRDRMLSIRPSPYKLVDLQQPIVAFFPFNLAIDKADQTTFASRSVEWETTFHAVFKLPLPYSLRVLRI